MRNIFPTSSCNAIHIAQLKMLPSNLDSTHCILILKPHCLCSSIWGKQEAAWLWSESECARALSSHGSPGCAETQPALSWGHCRALGEAGGFRQEYLSWTWLRSAHFCVSCVCLCPYVPCCSALVALAVTSALRVIIVTYRYSFIQFWHDLEGGRSCFQQWNQRENVRWVEKKEHPII